MNVLLVALYCTLLAAAGGALNGFRVYKSFVLPQFDTQTVTVGPEGHTYDKEVKVWVPGIVGQALYGAAAGFLVCCFYSFSPIAVGAQVAPGAFLMLHLGTALVGGLGASQVIDKLVDGKEWTKTVDPLLQKMPPNPEVNLRGLRTFQAVQELAS